jgi:ribosome biogenesis GTPase A
MSCPHAIADLTPRPLLRLRAHPLRIALVGNPNVGKSVIFGRLTGRYVTVSN